MFTNYDLSEYGVSSYTVEESYCPEPINSKYKCVSMIRSEGGPLVKRRFKFEVDVGDTLIRKCKHSSIFSKSECVMVKL